LTRALTLQPASDATRSTLVDLYAMQGRTRDEAAQREALAALDTSRPDGLVSLALAQARHGRSDTAVATLARAAERFPGSPVVANATGRVWLDLAETTGDPQAIQQALAVLAPAAARENASSETLALHGRAAAERRPQAGPGLAVASDDALPYRTRRSGFRRGGASGTRAGGARCTTRGAYRAWG
jgi:hypothetical protein